MKSLEQILRSEANAIAQKALEPFDLEGAAPQCRSLVEHLGAVVGTDQPLNTALLDGARLSDDEAPRIIHALAWTLIDELHNTLEGPALPEAIDAIRSALDRSVPVQAPSPEIEAALGLEGDAEHGSLDTAARIALANATALGDIAFLHGPSGALVYQNRVAKRILEYGDADIARGLCLFQILSPSAVSWWARQQSEESPTSGPWPCAVQTRHGTVIAVSLTWFPLGDKSGLSLVIARTVQVVPQDGPAWRHEDDADSMTLYQKMFQAEKLAALGEIVGGVAHELNNPLTGILGYAQLLSDSVKDEKTRRSLEQIASEAQRCRHIVKGLMSFSATHEPVKTLHDINDVVGSTLALRQYQLQVDNIAITVQLGRDLPRVKIMAQSIQRVFLSIINNAHQALLEVDGHQRALTVRTGVENADLFIAFEDNGPGIPRKIQSRIFDPFFSTKGVGMGTGLGLSVSYGVVRDHGGNINVRSDEGAGATFTVYLPAEITDIRPPKDSG